MDKYLYLIINILTIAFPLLRSFEPRIAFFSRWKGLLLAIAGTGLVFISWDIWYTQMGIWGFNPRYLTGIELLGLPIEEWLFFVTIPYACLFIYEVMNYYVKKDVLRTAAIPISYVLVVLLFILGVANLDKWYTSSTFVVTAVFIWGVINWGDQDYIGRFYIGYLVSLVPFLLVNGVLTGMGIPEEIVWYNNEENVGLRIGTIPIEDTVYMLLLLLMNTVIYEAWKRHDLRKKKEKIGVD